MIKKGKFKFCQLTNTMIVDNDYYVEEDVLVIDEKEMIEEYVEFIHENNIEKLSIELDDFSILRRCPGVRYVSIGFEEDAKEVDFTPLHEHPELKFFSRGINPFPNEFDYSKIKGLEFIYIYNPGKYDKNYNNIIGLKSICLWSNKKDKGNIGDLFISKLLDSVSMNFSSLKSLDGIEHSKKMQSLVLCTCRTLEDISSLKFVKHTLNALAIESCPRIRDFTVLEELENLEALVLSCPTTEIPNLNFLKKLKKLRVFIFSFNVLDGNLTLCKNIPYVFLVRGRKHYNLKDRDLPKQGEKFTRGVDGIPSWRCLSW